MPDWNVGLAVTLWVKLSSYNLSDRALESDKPTDCLPPVTQVTKSVMKIQDNNIVKRHKITLSTQF